MAKKKNNHHLYQDRNSGVWYFQKKVAGVSKPYKFSLETTSVVEARKKRDELLKEIEYHGRIPEMKPSVPTEGKLFGELAQLWAKNVDIEKSTFELYQRDMNNHVLPHFGNTPIDRITSFDIESFVSKLNGGRKYKRNVLTPFRAVIAYARKHEIIQQNPFDNVSIAKKKGEDKEKNSLDLDEINQFLGVLDDFWRSLFIVLFFTGMRIEELSALKWKRVNFQKKTIQIKEVLVRLKGGKIHIKPPKTDSSDREIKLSESIISVLREQRKRTWKGNGEDFIFLNKAGRPIYHHSLNHRVFKPILKKIGVDKKLSLKDTRASYITNSLDKKERMSFIQKQVGHATPDMIIRHYYRHTHAKEDGSKLENAWNSTRILPDQETPD